MNNREKLTTLINAYQSIDDVEKNMIEQLQTFIALHEHPMDQLIQTGHVTASGWVIDANAEYALLTHHRQLEQWFQLGGHCEDNETIHAAASREVEEESGLTSIRLLDEAIFSLDVHTIPTTEHFVEHTHYDIRFLFSADLEESFVVSAESNALAWVALDAMKHYTTHASIQRMVQKTVSQQLIQ